MEVQERNPLEGAALGADAQFGARPEIGPRQARVQEIDFRRPTKFARDLVRRLEQSLGGPIKTFPAGPAQTRSIGLITGGAGSEIYAVAREGIDTFITGEAPHWAAVAAEGPQDKAAETPKAIFHRAVGSRATSGVAPSAASGREAPRSSLRPTCSARAS